MLQIIKKNINFAHFLKEGELAQLARALRWQRRGHRFEPGILHHIFLYYTTNSIDYQCFKISSYFIDSVQITRTTTFVFIHKKIIQ